MNREVAHVLEQTVTAAYRAGWQAHRNGTCSLNSNPFGPTTEGLDWSRGWMDSTNGNFNGQPV